jgi:hypothetical protein
VELYLRFTTHFMAWCLGTEIAFFTSLIFIRVKVKYHCVVTGEKNSPTVAHACRKRRLKWVLGTWGYNVVTQSPGDINMETWSSRLGVGRGADDPTPEKVNS